MASNELRARLVGHAMPWGEEMVFSSRENGKHKSWMESPMPYDSDRNACAELLEYVAKADRWTAFIVRFVRVVGEGSLYNALNATPAQICAAFDATFAKELAELENKDAK